MTLTTLFDFPRRSETQPYRHAVGLVVLNRAWQVLIGITREGNIKLPQGGIEPGEAAHEAAERELLEETGFTVKRFLNKSAQQYSYDYPGNDTRYMPGYRGQKFTWFLVTAQPGGLPEDREFVMVDWVSPRDCLEIATRFVRGDVVAAQRVAMFSEVFKEFGLLANAGPSTNLTRRSMP